MAIRSARLRLLGAPERESRGSVPGGRTRHAHEWHHRAAAKKLESRPPSARSPAADVLSSGEVSELLGIPRSTVHYFARRGELPARRVGRRWLFLRDRLAAALAPLDDPSAWRPPNNLRRDNGDPRLKKP
jgi:excisionase family DNA binding protein